MRYKVVGVTLVLWLIGLFVFISVSRKDNMETEQLAGGEEAIEEFAVEPEAIEPMEETTGPEELDFIPSDTDSDQPAVIQPEPAEPEPAQPELVPPKLEVTGIMGGADPVAIVNDKIVQVGDNVEGAEVVEIGQDQVTFRYEGNEFVERLR